MNRADFQQLADVRIDEAEILLDSGKYDGAYYLAGYAVECGLKACIAKLTNAHDFPPPRKVVEDCYTHDIEKLVKAAGLITVLETAIDSDLDLEVNWGVVNSWSEASRYERKTEIEARTLFDAITDPVHGVLPWVKLHW